MSEPLRSPKLRPWHLDRVAVVYVRQSTPQQVADHRESTARQYALDDRAVTLGWTRDRVTPTFAAGYGLCPARGEMLLLDRGTDVRAVKAREGTPPGESA